MTGAVLIGACASLPEILYRVIGVFVWKTGSTDFSVFVGPGVFNILILGAVGGFAAKAPIR